MAYKGPGTSSPRKQAEKIGADAGNLAAGPDYDPAAGAPPGFPGARGKHAVRPPLADPTERRNDPPPFALGGGMDKGSE